MNTKFSSILIYLIISNPLAFVSSHTLYYVTTIASAIQDSTASGTQDSISTISKTFAGYRKYGNISIHATTVKYSRTSGLAQLISTVSSVSSSSLTAKDGKEVLHLSQVIKKRKNILKEIYWNRTLRSSDITKCSQVFEESIKIYSSCGKYQTTYADVLNVLVYRTLVQPVVIVIDQEPCSLQLASILKNSTSIDTGNYQEPLFHYVNDSFNLLSDLSKMLYKSTIHSATTIILLCSDSLIDLIFRLARSSAISYSNILWVTLEYSSTINYSLAPPLLLSISLKLDTEDAVKVVLNRNANKILVTKAVTSLGLKEQIITEERSVELIKQSLATSSSPSCTIQNTNLPVALILLMQSQHNWMTLYKVSSEGSVSQLVEDKKLSWLSRLKNHKAKISVTTIPEEPFVFVIKEYYNKYTKECSQGIRCRVPKKSSNGTVWEVSCCVGSIMDLLEKLRQDLWLSIDLHVAEDGFFGSFVNGTWNGMIGELIAGKADIAVATLTSTSKRSTVVDFGVAFFHITLGILVASSYADEIAFFNFTFVANVTGNFLLALLGMFISGLIILYAVENFLNRLNGLEKDYAFREAFSYLSGIAFQRDLGGGNPSQGATRAMFIVFAFGMVIAMTTYTATLTAVQVNQGNKILLNGMHDPKLMNPSDSLKFATLKSSSIQEYFRFSDNVEYQRMSAFMEKYNTDTNIIGAQKVLNRELQAFISEYPILQYLVSRQKDCLLRVIKTTSGEASWNIAFQKNSPWRDMISKKILEYKERGQLDDFMTKWTKSKCITQEVVNPTSQKYRIVHFSGLIILLACTLIFSIIILLGESWISKKNMKSSDYSLKNEE